MKTSRYFLVPNCIRNLIYNLLFLNTRKMILALNRNEYFADTGKCIFIAEVRCQCGTSVSPAKIKKKKKTTLLACFLQILQERCRFATRNTTKNARIKNLISFFKWITAFAYAKHRVTSSGLC